MTNSLGFYVVFFNYRATYSSLDLVLVRSSVMYTSGYLPRRDFLPLMNVVFDLVFKLDDDLSRMVLDCQRISRPYTV